MKGILKLWAILVFILSGCIGENYHFSPPALALSSDSNLKSEQLKEANIDWVGEGGEPIEKETKNIFSLAKEQPKMYFVAGEKVDLLSDHADFKTEGITVSVWQNEKKVDLDVNDLSFFFPKEKGEYVIEVNLKTDSGDAQYIGNVVLN